MRYTYQQKKHPGYETVGEANFLLADVINLLAYRKCILVIYDDKRLSAT